MNNEISLNLALAIYFETIYTISIQNGKKWSRYEFADWHIYLGIQQVGFEGRKKRKELH
jgi:hypothetical protein